jgi:hypothetical protein
MASILAASKGTTEESTTGPEEEMEETKDWSGVLAAIEEGENALILPCHVILDHNGTRKVPT